MSDHFPASITLGGRIPRRLLTELAERLADDHASPDWGHALDSDGVVEAIEMAAKNRQIVQFTNDQAPGGEFDQTEDFLQGHKLDYDRHSDAFYENDSVNMHCRAGRAWLFASGNDGCDLVGAHEIRTVLAGKLFGRDKLTAIAKLVAGPLALVPIVIVDEPKRRKRHA